MVTLIKIAILLVAVYIGLKLLRRLYRMVVFRLLLLKWRARFGLLSERF